MRSTKVLAIAPLLLAMYGCSSSSDSAAPIVPTAVSGLFLDAEVEGLSFTTDSGITGTTDENGTYEYIPGENISFSVGGVNIGSVVGAPKCTPYDFGLASTNIARFLQSLDADGDPSNGIDIVAANTALAGTVITSDAFAVDTATYEVNTEISGAVTTAGGNDVGETAALANLVAGTDDTFDAVEFFDGVGNAFVVIDPVNNGIGLMAFDASTVFSIFSDETTGAVPAGNGLGFEENWAVANGVLTFTDPVGGSVTTINRVGGSSRSISVTYSEDGATPLPATLLKPQPITYGVLTGNGFDGIGVNSTYDVVDSNGGLLNVVITRTAESADYIVDNNPGDTGQFIVGQIAPNVITITDTLDETAITFLIFLDPAPAVIDETANVLFVGATVVGGTVEDPDLEFNDIGVGSFTLKSFID